MMTPADGQFPEIDWEQGQWVDRPDDYVNIYAAHGMDKAGNEYQGDWVSCCGEVEIENIHPV